MIATSKLWFDLSLTVHVCRPERINFAASHLSGGPRQTFGWSLIVLLHVCHLKTVTVCWKLCKSIFCSIVSYCGTFVCVYLISIKCPFYWRYFSNGSRQTEMKVNNSRLLVSCVVNVSIVFHCITWWWMTVPSAKNMHYKPNDKPLACMFAITRIIFRNICFNVHIETFRLSFDQ